MITVGSEYAWVKGQAAWGSTGAVVLAVARIFNRGLALVCEGGHLLLSAGTTSYCLGKGRGGSREESQGVPATKTRGRLGAQEGRSRKCWGWSCVGGCGRFLGSMEPGWETSEGGTACTTGTTRVVGAQWGQGRRERAEMGIGDGLVQNGRLAKCGTISGV